MNDGAASVRLDTRAGSTTEVVGGPEIAAPVGADRSSTGRVSEVWFRVTDIEAVSGSGCELVAADGTRYLDFTSGIAVVNTGHCHPRVVAAIQDQVQRLVHAQVNVVRHPGLARLAGQLAAICPAPIDTFFVTNSGAEAVEAAVKLAKHATKRTNVIVFEGGFHGRTHLTMAMTTSKASYRAGYQPLPSGIFVAPAPVAGKTVEDCLAALDELFGTQCAPGETAAIVIEPVLGEGGYWPIPKEYLQGLRDCCREHGIMFVADEVQSGMGRTGTTFAVEQADVVPDIIVIGKGLGSGFPVAAIGASADVMARWPVGSHGGTYGGNPLACAAASATLEVLEDEHVLDNVRARGAEMRAGLEDLAAGDPGVVHVRGVGLMQAIELADASRVQRVLAHCREEGRLLLMTAGHHGTTIRLMPPLVVSAEEVQRALTAIAAALGATS